MRIWKKLYKLRKVILYLTIIVTTLLSGYRYGDKLFLLLILKNISLDGMENFHFDNNSLPRINTPLVKISLDKLYNIAQASPWVEFVTISRIFPDRIKLQVKEYKPFALWDKKFLITQDGHVIKAPIGKRKLLSVVGKGANTEVFNFIKTLSLNFYDNIKELEYISERRWNIKFNSGLTIKLPDDNYQLAWQKALNIIDKNQRLHSKIKSLDMRIPDKIFIKK